MNDDYTNAVDGYTIDGDLFTVLVNEENQYSVWPAYKAVPAGWKSLGHTGDKAEMTDIINKQWTDMRPLSLQKAMNND